MATTTDIDNARNQAKAQLDSIVAMVARMDHANGCDRDECELSDDEIRTGLGLWSEAPIGDEQRDEYHDEDAARQAIEEDALSVELRSGWYTPGDAPEAEEFMILLCTGGPAVRIIGELGEYNEPRHAYLQYQDWGTPWTEYITTRSDHQALLTYARTFYFGD